MLDKIAKVVARYDEIEMQMADPAIISDYTRLNDLAQERSDLQPLVEAYRQHQAKGEELVGARELLEMEDDSEMQAMAEAEIESLLQAQEELENIMRRLLVPKDARDDKNVFIEIRAGTGGDEAGIFAGDLLRMYTRYAETRGWKTQILDENSTGVGGYKEDHSRSQKGNQGSRHYP